MTSADVNRVIFSSHAAARWIERARPGLDQQRAAEELRSLKQCATLGHHAATSPSGDEFRLVLGDYAFPLVRRGHNAFLAVTCICTRGPRFGSKIHERAARRERRGRLRSPYRRPLHVNWLDAQGIDIHHDGGI